MFAVIELPDFPLQALVRMRPVLRGQPVGILRGEGRRAVVAFASKEAVAVRAGASAAQALADCPGLQLLVPSPDAEREADALLLNHAWGISPRVEASAPGRCTIDLNGAIPDRTLSVVNRIQEGLAHHGLHSRVGIAPTALVARYAAYGAEPVRLVADSPTFLAGLPIDMLDLRAEEARLLGDLGLRTLGAITRFPRAAFANRLGARGDEIWSRAAGECSAPIQPAPFPVRHNASIELEEAVETLEPLLFVLRRFCDRLADEVGQFGGGTNRLSLNLTLESEAIISREFSLPEPTARPEVLFAVLENHLATIKTDAPICGVTLEVTPARRLERQEGFFDTGLRDAPMFYATLGRLAAIVGAERIGTPQHGKTHRPDDIVLTPPLANIPERRPPHAPEPYGPLLWRVRPPAPATVELTDASPTFLSSGIVTGPVIARRRPFRANGDWWSAESWAREEWDVQVGHELYRLLHIPQGWFVDGIYD